MYTSRLLALCRRVTIRDATVKCKVRSKHSGTLPDGVWPTMITPFVDNKENSVDWVALDILTEWYIKSGVAGIFSVCLSSEMFQLTNDQRVSIARRVVDRAAGRVPVVAGATFEGGLDEQANLMNRMGEFVDAAVIITNQVAKMEDRDEVWIENTQKLLDKTGNLPLGLYETPSPQVRALTPSMMQWAAKTGRFVFHKDTSLSVDKMLEKLRAVQMTPGTPMKFYTAKTQFLKTLLDHGGNGLSGVTSNFHPWLAVWLCKSGAEAEENRCKVQRVLSVADIVLQSKYPTSAKTYHSKFYNVPIKPISKIHTVTMNDQDLLALAGMKRIVDDLCHELGVSAVHPMMAYSERNCSNVAK